MALRWRTLGLIATFVWVATLSWGLERHLSDPLHQADLALPAPDPAGRGLYLFLVDSLAPADVESMPAVAALREGGFSAIVEPCADNYTVPCTYELLTGRSTFSLFSFLENMGVIEGNSGSSLITDAGAAGWEVAVISRHDMDAWGAHATRNLNVTESERPTELAVGLQAAADHRLVFHHYVWHDVISHRFPRGHPRYEESLEELERFIEALEAGLPDGMDLLITGDHGHLDDGRHLQGLDTPTEVILRSPNVDPQRIEGRIPITAMRWLAGAVTGLGSDSARVAPEWRDWVHPRLGEGFQTSGAPLDPSGEVRSPPWLAMASALALIAISATALRRKVGVIVAFWGLFLGLAYPALHAANLEGWGPRAYFGYTPLIPIVGGLVALVRTRSIEAGWRAAVLVGLGFGLVLWPVMGTEGILRNAETILMPGMVVAAYIGVRQLVYHPRNRTPAHLGWVVLLLAAALLSSEMLSFSANDVRIKTLPLLEISQAYPSWMLPFGAIAAGILQGLTRAGPMPILAAVVALPLGTVLPVPLQAIAFLLTTVGFFGLASPHRRVLLVPALALCCGFMFERREVVGIMVSSMTAGAALMGALAIHRASRQSEGRSAVLWMGALALSVGTYTGMAWTLRLSVAGVDFGFILRWLPEGTHEQLWFVIFAACFVKTFLPAMLLHTMLCAQAPAMVAPMVSRALGITLLRAIFTSLFSLGWVMSQGPSAATRRLIRVLQQGYGWMFIALLLWILLVMNRRLHEGERSRSLERPVA